MRLKRTREVVMRIQEGTDIPVRWRRAVAVAAAAAVATVLAVAGCSSHSGSTGGPANSRGPAGTGTSAPRTPSATQPASSPAASQPSTAAQAAEALQGPAAQPTSAQLAALRAEGSVIDRLSPRQQAGQRVIYSYNGLTAPADLLSLIRRGQVGGVIFFSFNISSAAQIRSVIAQLVAANNSASNPARAFPLLLMTDQEGGQVRRLPGGPDQSQAQIGASADPAAGAATAGLQAAANLSGVGMNVNLAPVLDVFRQAGDFDDQFQRSYSMNPAIVAPAGAAFIRAQQQRGVAATAKHFPGLGAATASQNTDNGPVTISLPAQTLRSVDESVYRAAIGAGVKLVMVSWAKYPALGTSLPGGLAPTIIGGELRGRVGYTGATITDALGAGALQAYGSLQNKTMLAARAGMEALLCTATNPLPGFKCVDGLTNGLADGALPRTAFQAQLAQLLQLRASLSS
ncbi:MAG TPA: glycoside hydrolase family 3 N-terminal domain-containing protein [Streptosporangiaceae bacterium]